MRVGVLVLSAITQTPASGPAELVTTPPMSLFLTRTAPPLAWRALVDTSVPASRMAMARTARPRYGIRFFMMYLLCAIESRRPFRCNPEVGKGERENAMPVALRCQSAMRRRGLVGGGDFWGDDVEGVHLSAADPGAKAVHIKVDHGGGVEREHLADDKAADDGDAQGAAQLRSIAMGDGDGDAAKHSGHGGHHDGPETQQAGLIDGLLGAIILVAFGLDGEVD